MNVKIVGKSFAYGMRMAKDKVTEDQRGRKRIERTFKYLWSSWLEIAPQRGSAHPTFPKAILISRDAQQIEPGIFCEVTLTYEEPEATDSLPEGTALPPDEYTESVNDVEVPIEAHPNFATFATPENGAIFGTPIPPMAQGDFKGWTKDSPFSGYLTYKVGSVTETKTTYHWGKPASVSSEVGTKQGNWLVVSGAISRRYPYWVRSITRIYSANGWNSTIYPD